MSLKAIIARLKNAGTLLSVVSLVILILTNVGVEVDNEKVMTVVKAACSIGVLLGVLNNPDTPGLDLPGLNTTKDK